MNSKELLEQTGISRATLHNYIALGIVPRPDVLPPGPQDGAAPRIGYFPPETVQRIAEIQRLKNEGWSMARIAAHFGAPPPHQRAMLEEPAGATGGGSAPAAAPAPGGAPPRVTIDDIVHPAYLVDRQGDLSWFNPASAGVLAAPAAGQSALKSLLRGRAAAGSGRDALLRFHLGLVRRHGTSVAALVRELSPEEVELVQAMHASAQAPAAALVSHAYLQEHGPVAGAQPAPACIYAIEFREGTLFVHVPAGAAADAFAALLQERELVLGATGRRRPAVLREVAVLVTELDDAGGIWAALPPEEYFELINQIWVTADAIVRRRHGTHGKHPRDGMACYFLPQRDTSYIWNALATAHELRAAMWQVSHEWQRRKGWETELCMNAGLDEGPQWVGTLTSGTESEFTMFGDALNRAAALSDAGRGGALWATRNLLAKLTPGERQRVRFGAPRRDRDGREVFVPSVFSSFERLAGAGALEAARLRELARLPVTTIVDLDVPEAARARAPDPHTNP